MSAKSCFIVGAKRTAFGAFGGKLKDLTATELGALASKAALAQLPANTPVSSVIFGNVCPTSTDAAYLARHVGLRCQLPIGTPALTINRLCGSGFQAAINAIQEINSGDAEVVLTGGTENMSQAPYAVRNIRWGTRYGLDLKMEDTLAAALVDRYPVETPMAITAETLGDQNGITRQHCDEYALKSQKRWAAAQQAGIFKSEIVPVQIKTRKGVEDFAVDEHARPQTTIEGLAKLSPVFKKNGMVTAGNASGISDGAAAVVVAGEAAVSKYGLKPLARIVSYHVEGVEPTIMGVGPVPAIKGALKKAGLKLDDMDIIEINEAFAAQYLSCEKLLGIDSSIANKNGGAIALGHPLAASGSRIMAHLTYELIREKKRYAIGSACIGGGQGIAVILENMSV